MSNPFEGLAPESDPSGRREPHPVAAGKKVVYAGLALFAVALALVVVLESLGVEVWPRSSTTWERVTYRTFPANAGTSDLFYNRRVSKAEVAAVGEFLRKEGYFDADHPVSVFLTRDEREYQICLGVRRQSITEAGIDELKALRHRLVGEVFPDGNVVILLCDGAVRSGLEPQLTVIQEVR